MEPGDRRAARPIASIAVVVRMLGGVVVGALAFAVAYQLMTVVLRRDPMMALAVATAVGLGAAALALWRAVGPLVHTHAELQVRYEAALADALRDPLTSLGNHRAFHEELDRQVAAALRYGFSLSLLLIDIDEFKQVNDTGGHAAGDRLLRGFGELLSLGMRRADRAFRVGGDEFAVLLPHTNMDGGRVVARRLLTQALEPTLRLSEAEPTSFSGGISAIPEMALGPAQLYAQADTALYAAKRGGRTDIQLYDPAMDAEGRSGATASAVADVIANGLLAPAYQPIVALADGSVIGVEGLIRPVPPAPFANPAQLFAAAEAGGRTARLDLACIDAIVSGARLLPPERFLTVNLAPSTLEDPEFSSGALLAILVRYGFPPDRLIVELTERQAPRDLDLCRNRMAACRRAGIRFAADDIGAGNAGLRLLSEIEFEMMKVDLGLVQRSASDGPSTAVLGSVVQLAARTGALVVAEGIERPAQITPLLRLGVTVGQGFYLGRPASIEDAIEPIPTPAPAATVAGIADWRQSIGLPVN